MTPSPINALDNSDPLAPTLAPLEIMHSFTPDGLISNPYVAVDSVNSTPTDYSMRMDDEEMTDSFDTNDTSVDRTGFSATIFQNPAQESGEELLPFRHLDIVPLDAFTPHMGYSYATFVDHSGYADTEYTYLAFQTFDDDQFTGILLIDLSIRSRIVLYATATVISSAFRFILKSQLHTIQEAVEPTTLIPHSQQTKEFVVAPTSSDGDLITTPPAQSASLLLNPVPIFVEGKVVSMTRSNPFYQILIDDRMLRFNANGKTRMPNIRTETGYFQILRQCLKRKRESIEKYTDEIERMYIEIKRRVTVRAPANVIDSAEFFSSPTIPKVTIPTIIPASDVNTNAQSANNKSSRFVGNQRFSPEKFADDEESDGDEIMYAHGGWFCFNKIWLKCERD